MQPFVDRLEEDYDRTVHFVRLNHDTDAGAAFARRHRLPGVPSFVLLKADGSTVVKRIVGGPSERVLRQALDAALR